MTSRYPSLKYPVLLILLFALCTGCRPRGTSSQYQGKALREWESQAADANPEKRAEAAKALGKIGPKGLPALLPLLRDPHGHVRGMAALAMIQMGPAAVPKLKVLIHDPDPEVRSGAAKALAQTLVNMKSAGMPELIELFKDRDPAIRYEAAKSVPRAGVAGKTAIPALKEMMQHDDNETVRDAAALTLRIIDPKASQSKLRPLK